METFSLVELANRIPTEHDAYVLMEQLRWGDHPTCPHCDSERVYYLKPANGISRKTRTGAISERRVWKCGACRKQFSVLTGTIFHGSKIPLRTWLFVVFEACASKNGVAAREIERKYNLAGKTAWFMLHRIREAMKREPLAGMLRGTIVSDETWIGGNPLNRPVAYRKAAREARQLAPGELGNIHTAKTPVLSLINRETGEVRSVVVPDVTGHSLRKAIAEQVDMANSVLHTDEAGSYKQIGREFQAHGAVNHHAGEYVRGEVSTNAAEGYFSQLKRSIDGTHHHVSRKHLPRYLAEFDFRYSTCKLSDLARTRRLMGQVAGRRLTYRPAIGR